MPKVYLRLDPALRKLADGQQDPRGLAVETLARECVPRAVHAGMSDVRGKTYAAAEIIVIVETFDPLSTNTPHFEVVIEPGDVDETFSGRKMQRIQIVEAVTHHLTGLLQSLDVATHLVEIAGRFVRFDVECRPISGSGHTIVIDPYIDGNPTTSTVEASWGME